MGQINLNNFKVITDKLNTFFVDNKFMVASQIPTEGEFKVGDIIINNGPTNVDEPMWICIEAGNPGTWTVFNSGGGSGGRLSTARNRVVLNGESKSEVSIGVSGFNKASDVLMVFINSRFMTEGVDYEINDDSTKIVAIGEAWNEELSSEFEIEMIVFKMMGEEGVVSSVNEIVKLKNTVVVNEAVSEVEIGIEGFNEGDDLTVYRNSVYMIEGIDYEIQGNKIVSLKGAWNAEGGSDYKFTFEVLKTVAKINPDAVIGMEHLTEDVKQAIEDASNIDLSGYATKEELNELFQDVDSGKGIIADAIDDGVVTKDSTFAAMGEAIEGIHADREEDRQKLIEILQGSNMDLTGNESMDTLLDLIDMSNLDLSKIVQVACGFEHVFILYDDGRVYSCGNNSYGQLGLGTSINEHRYTFTQVDISDVKQVGCGQYHSYLLKNDGSLWACGQNSYGIGLSNGNVGNTFKQVTTNINNDVKEVVCGLLHTFIMKNDGSIWSCGNNSSGQLGIGGNSNITTFTKVTTNINNDVKQIACGGYHTFIIKNDGSLWSCGSTGYGELGLGNAGASTFTKVTTNIDNDVKQVACGMSNTFIIKNDGSLWSCGRNDYGQLGLNSRDNNAHGTFTQVTTNISNDVKQIACGNGYVFVLKNDGSLWSCGQNDIGQLGLGINGSSAHKAVFQQVTTNINNDVKEVVCSKGGHYTYILKNDGSLWACGQNNYGQLGIGVTANHSEFTIISESEALRTQVQSLNAEATMNKGNLATVLTDEGVELTGEESLADLIVKTDEEFDNMNSELLGYENGKNRLHDMMIEKGYDVNSNMTIEQLIESLKLSDISISQVKQLVCGISNTFIIKNDGTVWACGLNFDGGLGTGDANDRGGFTKINIDNVKQIACGYYHTMIIKNDGSLWACGDNEKGELGLNSTNNAYTFTKVTTNINNDVAQVACGLNYTFIIKNDGSLWSCGDNYYGQIGIGKSDNTSSHRTFTQVSTNVQQVVCGMYHASIIKTDGSLWTCGSNNYGQLGLGDTTNRPSFTQVSTNINNDVKQVDCGYDHTFILKNDGSVWSCGYNQLGQLGLGTSGVGYDKSSFTQVTTNINNDVKQIDCGGYHTCILKNDGSVWCTGYNYMGQIGNGTATDQRTFVKVTTNVNNDVKQIACGDHHTIILKNDNNIWACGGNDKGQLGLGSADTNSHTTFVHISVL